MRMMGSPAPSQGVNLGKPYEFFMHDLAQLTGNDKMTQGMSTSML